MELISFFSFLVAFFAIVSALSQTIVKTKIRKKINDDQTQIHRRDPEQVTSASQFLSVCECRVQEWSERVLTKVRLSYSSMGDAFGNDQYAFHCNLLARETCTTVQLTTIRCIVHASH